MIDISEKYNGLIIFGEMSSGKDTLADYLIEADKRCCKYNIGNVVRQFLSILLVNPEYIGKDRSFAQGLADKLREIDPMLLNDYCLSLYYSKWQKVFNWDNSNLDNAAFNAALMNQLEALREKEIPVIVGGRTYNDFDYWTNKNFLTVGIVCNQNKKFERLILRDGLEVAQNSNFNHNTEVDVADIVNNKCKFIIDNSGDIDHLKLQADELLKIFT